MKRILFTFIIMIFAIGCISNDDSDTIVEPNLSAYEPITLLRSDFENAVKVSDPIPIENSGKIYIRGSYLFINEVHKGFHVYDNSDPKAPVALRFLAVPGATDIGVRNEVMYINQATDLIAVVYDTTAQSLKVTKRIPKIFPKLRSPDGFLPFDLANNQVVVGWKLIKN